ncbi:GGDEF domain-containing protein [Candidatus Binatia bacterium]|jgi:diguanylate cyclase (GGDEF)-like protein|nr:GGDEF domain-containing protein [Candidatus Binatia bacterium]
MRLTRHGTQEVNPLETHLAVASGWVVGGLVAALAAIFALDARTGEAPVQHLYYLPIMVAAARFGRVGGVATALAAIVLYHVANRGLLLGRALESDLVQCALFILLALVTARLVDDANRLRVLSCTDDLTGLHNLRSFESHLARMVDEAHRRAAPLSLLVLDVDHLKDLNDHHGHLAGAEAVRAVGGVIARHVPAAAVACRYGGDEFVIALPAHPAERADAVADDIRRAVQALAPRLAGHEFAAGRLSVSIGVATRSFQDGDGAVLAARDAGERLFHAADQALYRAKDGGRNRVCHGAEESTASSVTAVRSGAGGETPGARPTSSRRH